MKKIGNFELDKVYCGDCKKEMKYIPSNSIDLIVTDPPYQLDSIKKRWGKNGKNTMHFDKSPHHRTIKGFMGKEWDVLPPIEVWQESLRVLKPGAFAFIMTTPRQDSLCQILMDLTNAGFYMGFTSIYWTYASGFPKASNIGLMVDKRECKKQLTEKLGRKPTKEEFKKEWEGFREIVGEGWNAPNLRDVGHKSKEAIGIDKLSFGQVSNADRLNVKITKAVSEQAKSLNGSYAGFQPKPAVEVIIVAMKPLSEKTYVDQALKNRKGITWLDDCKIPSGTEHMRGNVGAKKTESVWKNQSGFGKPFKATDSPKGRFPANLLVSDDVLNDGKDHATFGAIRKGNYKFGSIFGCGGIGDSKESHGSFSRYFDLDKWAVSQGVKDTFPFLIVPKASKSEKNRGCEKLTKQFRKTMDGGEFKKGEKDARGGLHRNIHPTVKPIKLGTYLILLGSREGDIMLDNFCGSGTFLVGAKMLNRRFLGFDTEMEYVEISRARLSAVKQIQEKLL